MNKPSPVVIALLELLKSLLSIWMFLGLLKIYLALSKEEKPSLLELFKGFPMVLNLLVSQILLGFMMVASILAVFLVVGLPLWLYFFTQGDSFSEGLAALAELPKPYVYLYNWSIFLFIGATVAPIIWTLVRFMLMPFFIVDCYEGPIEALKMSYRASRGVSWDLFVLLFITFLLLLLGFAFFGVGLLFTIPIAYLTQTFGYLELVETTSWKVQDAP